jgi:hypothetical protein
MGCAAPTCGTSWVFQGVVLPGVVSVRAVVAQADAVPLNIHDIDIHNNVVVVGLIVFGVVQVRKIVDLYLIPLMTRRFNNALIDHLQRKPMTSLSG